MPVAPSALAFLLPAAFCAGIVDAIGGGGGLITLPALLAAGLPPHVALGTNKGQSVFGSSTALYRFARAGLVHGARARVTFPLGFVGSLLGVQLALRIAPDQLRPIVLTMLVGAAVVIAVAPGTSTLRARFVGHDELRVAAVIALVIGTYDGFFGPGTGTFLIVAFVLSFGADLTRASADAKVVNFASNLAAVLAFSLGDAIAWSVALPMAAAQLCGAVVGSHLVLRGGERLVRVTVLVVVVALVVKLALDLRG